MSYCVKKTKASRINKHKNILKIDNLHFLPNNIFTRLFKQLKKNYKNDYQQYLNYICKNYTMHLNVYLLSISMHMHGVIS